MNDDKYIAVYGHLHTFFQRKPANESASNNPYVREINPILELNWIMTFIDVKELQNLICFICYIIETI